ncbi:type VII secretion protein EccCa [Microbacterium sp. 22242]|uniref:type VII secretion protein EccCa n=1 Tax=Microbacterium sp. 22242 TaxID=3453896 RepID=UPI003F86A359
MTGPRLAPPRVPSGKLTVQAPPELQPSDGGSNLLTSMLPMLGSIGAVVMVGMTNQGPGGFLIGGMVLVSSLGFVLVNGWRQRSQKQATTLAARREYLAYLTELRESVRVAARQQRRAANWQLPAPAALPYVAEDRTRIGERSPADPDFLSVRVGLSDQPLCITLEAPELPPLAQLDPVAASAAHRFMLAHSTQTQLPLGVALRDYARVEVTGDEDEARSLARAMLLHVATMHDPEDVQIVIAADQAVLPQWEWAKWLPHTHSRTGRDALGPARMIGTRMSELEELLPAGMRERPRFSRGAGSPPLPHIVVLTDGVQTSTLVDGVAGVTVIDLPSRWSELEDQSTLRLALSATQHGAAELVSRQALARPFEVDGITIVEAEATARRLISAQPTALSPAAEKAVLRGQAELVDLLDLPDVRDVDFDTAWAPRLERDRLRVPIGQTEDGAPLILDIKESAQLGMGPHGLIIGATGSGKSEVLRTLVLALTLTHSPEQLNFVLVDFKGGATFAGMSGMPHVSAIITNLGSELSLVDRFQDALQGEVVRRQELLRAAGNFANVSDYEKARRGGRTDLAPLPALLIVADEFSELLAAKPEFVESFVNIGRVGRSLQVHLLLASQRLEEGKLRGLDTYLSYRIGLRTFSASESRAVLGVPDAYHLPPEPGVGFLKSDTETMTQFRAAYVSGTPPRRRRAVGSARRGGQDAAVELFTAAPVPIREQPVEEQAVADAGRPAEPEETRNTFEIAVERMSGRGPEAHRVWLPPLEIPPTLGGLFGDLVEDPQLGLVSPRWRAVGGLTVPLGIVDVPLEQRREDLVISLGGAAGHMAIVGAPLSGKSTLARTTVVALALTHTPHEVQFFVLDFGGGSFAGMQGFTHLSGLATRSEPDVVRRTINEITSLLNAREVYFRQNGIDSIDTYRRRRAEGSVDDGYGDIFLVVDGWGTLRAEFENLEPEIQAIAARGLTYGVHVILTASRWMEVRANIKDLIGTRIELRLGDASDSEVDRKAAANVTSLPGRGLNSRGLQMLTALPRVDGIEDASSLADGVDDLQRRVGAAWRGPAGPKLRLLPDRITHDELRALAARDAGGTEPRELLLGIDEANLAPFSIDPLAEPLLYLYGDADSGKSSMLRGVVHEIMRLYAPNQAKIFAVDYRRALLGEIPQEYLGAYLTSHELAEGGMGELAAFFRSRIPGPDVTPEQLRTRSWWTGAEGFVLIDDYDLVATSQGNPITALAPLLAQAGDLGLHVILTRRTGGASRAAYDPIIQRMTDLGATGILLSGSPEEGPLIGKIKAVPSIPGRAQIVSRDRGLVAAQLLWVPPRYS